MDILNQLIATKTYIDSLDYRSITSVPSEDDKKLKKLQKVHKFQLLQ